MIPEVWKKWWFWAILIPGCVLVGMTSITTLELVVIAFLWGFVWGGIARLLL